MLGKLLAVEAAEPVVSEIDVVIVLEVGCANEGFAGNLGAGT